MLCFSDTPLKFKKGRNETPNMESSYLITKKKKAEERAKAVGDAASYKKPAVSPISLKFKVKSSHFQKLKVTNVAKLKQCNPNFTCAIIWFFFKAF